MPLPLPEPIVSGQPLTALAPMQDVTDLDFMRVVAHYGAPDYFVTEYFRVHSQSTPERHILRTILENDTGRPVFAQLLGESLPDIGRTLRELLRHPWAGIDLNLGCPAPKVYKKHVGGGLLRDVARIDEILGFMRAGIPGRFTVKMRLGFDGTENFDAILALVAKHRVDLLTVHARTVKEMYRSEVRYPFHGHAARSVPCPVLANGNILSARCAAEVVTTQGVAGVMVGRHAIRNPWIFAQIRRHFAGLPSEPVPLIAVRDYVARLYSATRRPGLPEGAHVSKMKKYLNFVGQGVDPEGRFLFDMRRAMTEAELFAVCDRHLLRAGRFADEPYPGVIARPNCETPAAGETCSLDSVTA